MITARNYLDVYPYDKWSDKVPFVLLSFLLEVLRNVAALRCVQYSTLILFSCLQVVPLLQKGDTFQPTSLEVSGSALVFELRKMYCLIWRLGCQHTVVWHCCFLDDEWRNKSSLTSD